MLLYVSYHLVLFECFKKERNKINGHVRLTNPFGGQLFSKESGKCIFPVNVAPSCGRRCSVGGAVVLAVWIDVLEASKVHDEAEFSCFWFWFRESWLEVMKLPVGKRLVRVHAAGHLLSYLFVFGSQRVPHVYIYRSDLMLHHMLK